MKSFVVEVWAKIFNLLRWLSFFQLIRTLIPATRKSCYFVDLWVMGHLIFSFIIASISNSMGISFWEWVFIVYAAIRIFEIFIYQINVLLFDEYRTRKKGRHYALRGYRRLIILLLNNYFEIIFWFIFYYRNFGYAFNNGEARLIVFWKSLNLSFFTMTNFGHSSTLPISWLGEMIVFAQSFIGLFMALLILARFIALIPTPESIDENVSRRGSKFRIHTRVNLWRRVAPRQ